MYRLELINARIQIPARHEIFIIQADGIAELYEDCCNIEEFYNNPQFDEEMASDDEEMTSADETGEFYSIQRKSDRRKTVKNKTKANLRYANMLCDVWRLKTPKKRIQRLDDILSKYPDFLALRHFKKLNRNREVRLDLMKKEESIAKKERILRREDRDIRAKYLGEVNPAELFDVFE